MRRTFVIFFYFYFSYDLGRRVEKLPEIAINELSTPDMAVGLYDWAIIVDHQLKSACIALLLFS